MKKTKNKGFTMIEMVVVIAIMAILFGVTVIGFRGRTQSAKGVSVKSDIRNVQQEVERQLAEGNVIAKGEVYIQEADALVYNAKGLVESPPELKSISPTIATSNSSTRFVADADDQVYFVGEGKPIPFAVDSDFSFIGGHYRYVGEDTVVKIPTKLSREDGTVVQLTSYSHMFNTPEGQKVTKVISTNKDITAMSSMFYSSLASEIDLTELDTSNVTTMEDMFRGAEATNLDLSTFNTSNVTDMYCMFRSCKAKSLNLSSFDFTKVKDFTLWVDSARANPIIVGTEEAKTILESVGSVSGKTIHVNLK